MAVRASRLTLAVLAAGLAVLAIPSQAAPSMHTHVDWTEGSFEAGLVGAGKTLFPSFVDAPDHERIPLPINPCHRQLSLGIDYEPRNASLRVSHEGNAAEGTLPYRFQAGLVHPNGTVLHRIVVDEPDLSVFFGIAPEPGAYELELELLEGALVDWEVRMRGFAVDDPACDVWLNEVETNAGDGTNWVELYNEGDRGVDVAGWGIVSNATGSEHVLPDDLVLGAGDRVRVDVGPGGAFSPANETVSLVGPTGAPLDVSATLEDRHADERTWQKAGDGLGDWIFADGTPGAPNAG